MVLLQVLQLVMAGVVLVMMIRCGFLALDNPPLTVTCFECQQSSLREGQDCNPLHGTDGTKPVTGWHTLGHRRYARLVPRYIAPFLRSWQA
jgi:hypothetical protein